MNKSQFRYILLLFLAVSCSAEKINLSPIGNAIVGQSEFQELNYEERKNIIVYSSEITNLIATFPKFRNDAVNYEVAKLKIHLKDYITAINEYNVTGLESSLNKFEKSYKKLQRLRKYLNSDEDQILNRYLVRIKTNMSLLEGNLSHNILRTAPKN